MSLKNTVDLRRIDSSESCSIANDENEYVKAVSYSDGRIEIHQGDELANIIGRQFSILLDAAISGDGSLAVTLSREKFNGKILYFTEDRCAYKLSSQIITAFNTKTYDFSGVECSDELSEILRQNRCKL